MENYDFLDILDGYNDLSYTRGVYYDTYEEIVDKCNNICIDKQVSKLEVIMYRNGKRCRRYIYYYGYPRLINTHYLRLGDKQ